ncbi:MAG: glycosyltransferase [Flavobacteriia bacterium]|nr:MAG: glycosyltransferase [Flavobacteriia bacterium]
MISFFSNKLIFRRYFLLNKLSANIIFNIFTFNLKSFFLQRIVVSVINDLVTDQRVKKICSTLQELDYDITLIGRELPESLALDRNYRTIRMKLLFRKKFLFYAEYNIRLFFKLLSLKSDVYLANDLDTLLPNYLISRLFSKKLVYDSHELFTEVPELTHRPPVRKVWLKIEKYIFPKLKNVYTVNKSIASFYQKRYQIPVKVIRNIAPKLKNKEIDTDLANRIKGKKKMLILQGTGINMDRGAEEAVKMMEYLDESILYIIGGGDIFSELKDLVKKMKLTDKVFILNRMPYDELMEYTKIADLGLSLDKGSNLNYEYSLPNKIFDYIQAEIPLFVSNRIEVARIVNENQIGYVTQSHDPKTLAKEVENLFKDQNKITLWKKNLKGASEKYNWEKESEKLKEIFSNLH